MLYSRQILAEPHLSSARVTSEIPKLRVDKRITAKARICIGINFSYMGTYPQCCLSGYGCYLCLQTLAKIFTILNLTRVQWRAASALFFIFVACYYGGSALLQLIFQIFVYGERDGLTRGNTHNSGCDALVESMKTLLPVGTPSNNTVSAIRR